MPYNMSFSPKIHIGLSFSKTKNFLDFSFRRLEKTSLRFKPKDKVSVTFFIISNTFADSASLISPLKAKSYI